MQNLEMARFGGQHHPSETAGCYRAAQWTAELELGDPGGTCEPGGSDEEGGRSPSFTGLRRSPQRL